MKKTLVILLISSFMGCTISSTGTSSRAADSVDATLVDEDSTSILWNAIVDSIKEIGLRDVIECYEANDMSAAIEIYRKLNGEKEIRALYPRHQVGDTLFFVQDVRCNRESPRLYFWKKDHIGNFYTYRRKNSDSADTVYVRQFDELDEYRKDFFKACNEWDMNYLSSYDEFHKHLFQTFIFRVIIKEKGEFQMDYVSRVFQERRDLFL